MSEDFEIFNLELKPGESVKLKGKIPGGAKAFYFNLGRSPSDVALHVSVRMAEKVIVCNTKRNNSWEKEQRDGHQCFSPGTEVKILIKFNGDKFEVKLPDGHEISFPNRLGYDKITYMAVNGDFKVISYKHE
ncbi:hypothetical protein GDO78_009631 [Eleutherodactylus coqui]|uniref:Galectin n=1 Tax=Eleutherodactylus coqui TaxID=57060 RepID=A0A8J6K7N8_ELECQ|nr:hypothetical protein GDO78_009631 [Eleutherodactylus coqui]